MNLSPETYIWLANAVNVFHVVFVLAMTLGAILQVPAIIFNKKKLVIGYFALGLPFIVANGILGDCPITMCEKWLLAQADPGLVYEGSFIAYLLNHQMGFNFSESTVGLIFLVALLIVAISGMVTVLHLIKHEPLFN